VIKVIVAVRLGCFFDGTIPAETFYFRLFSKILLDLNRSAVLIFWWWKSMVP